MKEFYFKKTVKGELEDVRMKVESSFKEVGFGVLTEINIHEKFKEKLNKDFEPYVVLGICNPKFAYEAIHLEDNIGVFLPCKIVLKKTDEKVEVVVLDPSAPMQLMENPELDVLAEDVSKLLKVALNKV